MDRERIVDLGSTLAVFAAAFAVYFASPELRIADSRYTVLLSESLLDGHGFDLSRHFWPHTDSASHPWVKPGLVWPRHVQPWGRPGPGGVREAQDRVAAVGDDPPPMLYIYPAGTSIYALPFVAVLRAAGLTTYDPVTGHAWQAEMRMQKWIAALWMAFAAALFFATARLELPRGWSLLVVGAGAFGTLVWSIASRSLQAHAALVLAMAGAVHLLLRAEHGAPLRPVALATLAAMGFWARPTAVTFLVPLALFVLLRHPRRALPFAATGLAWLAAFLAYSRLVFDAWLPPYYADGGFRLATFGLGLAANLFAPSRSIFVYSPYLLVVGYGLWHYRARLRARGLVAMALAACLFHLLVVSAKGHWWGPGYGPRFLTDVVPLFVLLSILALRAALDARANRAVTPRRRRIEAVALAAAVAASVVVHGAGAISPSGNDWNLRPVGIDHDPKRVFDWRRPQWWVALRPSLLPEAAAPADDDRAP